MLGRKIKPKLAFYEERLCELRFFSVYSVVTS
jgi:hypothetical protein